jgi:branched-chain amino acid transport system substrate-binding protein
MQLRIKMLAAALLVTVATSGAASAQEKSVKIGALYPLSGQVAKSGEDTLNAIKLAVQIVNGANPESKLPFGKTAGLPNLGGAKLELVVADHQGSPEIGAAEAERLIAQEKVSALIGAFHSSVAATSSQVAERYQIPYLSGESEATTLTERKFKNFFRTTPSSRTQAQDFFTFLRELNKRGGDPVKTVAIVSENTLWGQEFAKSVEGYFKEFPEFTLAAKVSYAQGTTDVSSEVQRLIAAKPDVVMHASYDAEAILFAKTYKSFGFQPNGIMAIGAAFGSGAFRTALGADANYFLVREHWARDLASKNALIDEVGKLYEKTYGKPMDGTPARAFQATMVLADAINRAGSAEPAKIRKALAETNLPADQLIMPWEGVRFDEHGQNTLTRGIFIQTQGGAPATVWPFDFAQAKLVWPRPAWK